MDNNPAIADLSDPNRPTKLAEVYNEIYDNEWTDALDKLLQSGYDEETAIETLRLTLLVNCFLRYKRYVSTSIPNLVVPLFLFVL